MQKYEITTFVITPILHNKLEQKSNIKRVDCSFGIFEENEQTSQWRIFRRKLKSFFELWLPFIIPSTSRYWRIYIEAESQMKSQKFDFIIATGEPFILFKFAELLSKRHNIPWIADYRDNWSNEPTKESSRIDKLFFEKIWRRAEKKLLKSANQALTVGQSTANRIKQINASVRINIVENGHNIPDNFVPSIPPSDKIRITHIGRLYKHRNPQLFFDGVREWIKKNPDTNIELCFLGIEDFPFQKHDLIEKAGDIKKFITTTPSMEYSEMLEYASGSHVFLQLADPNLPLTNGKMYDYLGMRRPILLIPDDNSVFSSLIRDENAGFILNNIQEIISALDLIWANLSNPEFFETKVNTHNFSREKGAEILAGILKQEQLIISNTAL